MKRVIPFVILLMLVACVKTQTEISGVWKVDSFTMNGLVIPGANLGSPLYEFNTEGGYMIMVSGVEEKGTFTLKDNTLTYHCTSQSKPDQNFRIQRLDSLHLEYETTGDSNKLVVKMTRQNAEL